MTRILLARLLLLAGLLLPAGATLADPPATRPTTRVSDDAVRVTTLESPTPEGLARGWVARIDLTDPRVQIVVSDPFDADGKYAPKATDHWAADEGLTLAVNANYFGLTGPIGLVVRDGKTLSPARAADPVLLVHRDHASVVVGHEPDLAGVQQAVAGVGATTKVPLGAALVTDGRNTGADARVAADQRHPRTAAGVTPDGRTLILMAVDGRLADWSAGVTLPELADLMIAAGAADAVNLDGGGSTAFYWRDAAGTVHGNRPSEGEHRPVAVSLGVRVDSTRPH